MEERRITKVIVEIEGHTHVLDLIGTKHVEIRGTDVAIVETKSNRDGITRYYDVPTLKRMSEIYNDTHRKGKPVPEHIDFRSKEDSKAHEERPQDRKKDTETRTIPNELYKRLEYLGIIDNTGVRNSNEGKSNYSSTEHLIQPWSIWLDYPTLTAWDKDIIKRILRTKEGDARELDYRKCIHILNERLRQIAFKKEDNA